MRTVQRQPSGMAPPMPTQSRGANETETTTCGAPNDVRYLMVNPRKAHHKEVRLLQVNLCKNKERTHGILNDPITKNVTILLLQEQYWSPYDRESPNHNAWLKYEPMAKEDQPRATTYINKARISAAQIVQLELPFKDVVALRVKIATGQPQLFVINVYNPCGQENIVENLRKAIQSLKIKKPDVVIMAGDFNCHHPMWNTPAYHKQDAAADALVDLAATAGLGLLIPPGTTTFPGAGTAIDLVWGNLEAEKRILKCRVAPEYDQGSDHDPVETVLLYEVRDVWRDLRYDTAKTDWEDFNGKLRQKLQLLGLGPIAPHTAEEVDRLTNGMIRCLQETLQETTPVKRLTVHSKRWWSTKISNLCKEQKRLKNRWKHTRAASDKIAWREKANEYTAEISRAKQQTWQSFVQNANGKSIWDVKKYLAGSNGQRIIPTLDNKAETFKEITDTLSESFFPQPPPAYLSDINNPNLKYPNAVPYESWITIEQVR